MCHVTDKRVIELQNGVALVCVLFDPAGNKQLPTFSSSTDLFKVCYYTSSRSNPLENHQWGTYLHYGSLLRADQPFTQGRRREALAKLAPRWASPPPLFSHSLVRSVLYVSACICISVYVSKAPRDASVCYPRLPRVSFCGTTKV
jgi:hypothetical protein